MEIELESRMDHFKRVQVKLVKEEEMQKFERRLDEMRRLMEATVTKKVKSLQARELIALKEKEEGVRLVEGQRHLMERNILKQMKELEDENMALKQKKTKAYF